MNSPVTMYAQVRLCAMHDGKATPLFGMMCVACLAWPLHCTGREAQGSCCQPPVAWQFPTARGSHALLARQRSCLHVRLGLISFNDVSVLW